MRSPTALILAAAVLGGSASAAVAVAQEPDEPPLLRAVLEDCETGESEDDRRATFVGSMPATQATRRMAMRFTLERRASNGGPWRRVRDAPRFGSWERSDPRVRGFVFTKRVEGLPADALFRAVVRFRWYDDEGHRLRERTRTTRACRQPEVLDSMEGP